jgi:hypothetical protein
MSSFTAFMADWINALDQGEFWAFGVITLVASVYGFYAMYKGFHDSRLMENLPTSRIRSASQGYVELSGIARDIEGTFLFSKLTQTQCLWFRFKVEEKRTYTNSKGQSRSKWVVVEEGVSDDLFMIDDQTGQCAIDPDGARVVSKHKSVWYDRKWLRQRRYTEELIQTGDDLYAIGLFKTESGGGQQSIREQVSLLLREWKQDNAALLEKYDTDGDGTISMSEWERVRRDADLAIKREITEQARLAPLHIMINSPERDQPYILSTYPETHLVKKYKTKAYLGMAGFLLAGTVLVWALNIRVVLW